MTPEAGRLLFVLGVLIAAAGLAAMLGIRLPLGHLPGDITIAGSHVAIVIPIATSILLSIVLTVVANVLLRR